MRERTAYEINNKVYKTEKEAVEAEKLLVITKLLNSIDGHIDHEYPSRAGIVKDVLIELLKMRKLSKTYLSEIVDILEKEEEEDYE